MIDFERLFLTIFGQVIRRYSLLIIVVAIMMRMSGAEPAGAQDAPHLEPPIIPPQEAAPPPSPPPSRVPTAGACVPASRKDQWKKRLADLPPFFRDTKLAINPRVFLFYRDNFDRSLRTALASGGSLDYTSGYLWNRLRVGAVGYTAIGLHCPPDRDGTMLLKPGQKNIYVLGQMYGEIRVKDDFSINIFRKDYNTPYINRSDTRMIPNTFEAYTVSAKIGNVQKDAVQFRLLGGYFTKIKYKDSSSFIPMSQIAGVRNDRGVSLVSGILASERLSFEVANYYCQDVINIFYTEAEINLAQQNGWACRLSGQFSDQESLGDNLLLKRPFSTRQFGIQGNISLGSGVFTCAYTQNAIGGTDLKSYWGTYPGFTSVQVRDFNRAGEQAFLIKGSYDFSHLGLEGLNFFVRWVRGCNRVNPATRKPVPNEDELDVDFQWKPKSGLFQNLWFRLRCARVFQRGGENATLDDIRFIVNYHFPVL